MRMIALIAALAAGTGSAQAWGQVSVTDKASCRVYFADAVRLATSMSHAAAYHERQLAGASDRTKAAQIVAAHAEVARLYADIADAAHLMCRAYD